MNRYAEEWRAGLRPAAPSQDEQNDDQGGRRRTRRRRKLQTRTRSVETARKDQS